MSQVLKCFAVYELKFCALLMYLPDMRVFCILVLWSVLYQLVEEIVQSLLPMESDYFLPVFSDS